jgi:hypothetical protein
MFKIMAFMSRKPGITTEEFRTYYEDVHTRLIADVAPAMKAYRRNYIDLSEPFQRCAAQIDFDVVTEMEFADRAECQRWYDAFSSPASLARVLEDERQFLDGDKIRVSVVHVRGGG